MLTPKCLFSFTPALVLITASAVLADYLILPDDMAGGLVSFGGKLRLACYAPEGKLMVLPKKDGMNIRELDPAKKKRTLRRKSKRLVASLRNEQLSANQRRRLLKKNKMLHRMLRELRVAERACQPNHTSSSNSSQSSLSDQGNCNDRLLNGNEEGIDCGGRCPNPCPAIQAVITASRTECAAPCAVFFDATETTHSDATLRPFHELDFTWDFNDPASSSLNKVTPNFDHNKTKGPVSAHVFDPGYTKKGPGNSDISAFVDEYGFYTGPPLTYVVELSVKDPTYRSVVKKRVNIAVKPFQGRTLYIDSETGSDSNSGTLPTQPWKSIEFAFKSSAVSSGDRVLLKRGATFAFTRMMTPRSGVAYASYGSGSRPLIQYAGTENNDMVAFGLNRETDVSFIDLHLNLNSSVARCRGFHAYERMQNNLLLRLLIEDANYNAVQANGQWSLDGLFVADSEMRKSHLYQLIFLSGSRFVFLNNIIADSNNHLIYGCHIDRGIFIGNYFARPSFGRHALRISASETAKVGPSNSIVVADNIFEGWIDPDLSHGGGGTRYNWLMVHFGPNDGGHEHQMDNILFEHNRMLLGETLMAIANGFSNLTIRNNTFTIKGDGNKAIAFSSHVANTGQPDGTACINPGSFRTEILNNSFVMAGQDSTALRMDNNCNPVNHREITFKNNLIVSDIGRGKAIMTTEELKPELTSDSNIFYLPNIPAPFQLSGSALNLEAWKIQTAQDSLSSLEDPLLLDPDGIDNSLGTPDDDLHLQVDSVAIDRGVALPFTDDADGVSRPQGAGFDIGAYEYVGQ